MARFIHDAPAPARRTSDILREKPGFRSQTRMRVLDVAGEVGYQPSFIGRTLTGGGSMSIGVIFPTLSKSVFAQRAVAMGTTLRDAGDLTFMMHVRSREDQSLLGSISVAAAEMVYSMLEHPERPVETARFRCELVIRDSTGAMPGHLF